jgi:hypothetical protein
MFKKRVAIVSVLAIMGASSLIAICFDLDYCPCAEVSTCDSYPDGSGAPYLGPVPPAPQPGSVGYAGLTVTPYPSGVLDYQQTGWNSSSGFTQGDFYLEVCWSAATVVFYSGPDCSGQVMASFTGFTSGRTVHNWTWPPAGNRDCNRG